jgi:hypothetical protein
MNARCNHDINQQMHRTIYIHDKYQTRTCFGTGVDPEGVVKNKEKQVRHAELGIASLSLE